MATYGSYRFDRGRAKAWERRGIALGTARALVNAGFLTVDDLRATPDLELAAIPRVGAKSLAILFGLMGREMSTGRRTEAIGSAQIAGLAP
jgi:hypothetical protein